MVEVGLVDENGVWRTNRAEGRVDLLRRQWAALV
jgi:hypothetical protein